MRQRRGHGRAAFAIIKLNRNLGGEVGLDQTFLPTPSPPSCQAALPPPSASGQKTPGQLRMRADGGGLGFNQRISQASFGVALLRFKIAPQGRREGRTSHLAANNRFSYFVRMDKPVSGAVRERFFQSVGMIVQAFEDCGIKLIPIGSEECRRGKEKDRMEDRRLMESGDVNGGTDAGA